MKTTPLNAFRKAAYNKRYKILFAALLLTGILSSGCKKDRNEALEREQQKADSLLKASIADRKRLETQEELAERVRRSKNNGFTSNDSVYSHATAQVITDSLLSGIRLVGKANTNGKINTFVHTAVAVDGRIVKGVLSGEIFRSEKNKNDTYTLYSLEKETGRIKVFELNPLKEPLALRPTVPEGNYFFDLLTEKVFHPEPRHPERYFKTIKSDRLFHSYIADSLFPNREVYHDRRPLFPENLNPPVQRVWVRKEDNVSNILLPKPADSTSAAFVLSSKRRHEQVYAHLSSRFVNDSLLRQYDVRDSLVYDHPHLVVYQKDSITRLFQYNSAFEFTLIKTDSVRTIENYPQQYQELRDSIFELSTETFEMNNRKVSWNYRVGYEKNIAANHTTRLRIYQKDLIEAATGTLIFRLPREGTPATSSIPELLTPKRYFKQEDLNFDGYTDLSFRKGSDNNGNPAYVVYLYNSNYGRFSRTPELDGVSIENGIVTDEKNKRLLYPAALDNGHLSVSIISRESGNSAQKEIYWTTGSAEAPQLHYQKMVDNNIVEKRSPLIDSLPVKAKDLKTGLVQWILKKG